MVAGDVAMTSLVAILLLLIVCDTRVTRVHAVGRNYTGYIAPLPPVTGWLRQDVYPDAKCAGTSSSTTYTQLGLCGSTDGRTYSVLTGSTFFYVNATVTPAIAAASSMWKNRGNYTVFRQTFYSNWECTGPPTASSAYYNASQGQCVPSPNNRGTSYVLSRVTAAPTPPAFAPQPGQPPGAPLDTRGQFTYTSQRACLGRSQPSLHTVTYTPSFCSPQGTAAAQYVPPTPPPLSPTPLPLSHAPAPPPLSPV